METQEKVLFVRLSPDLHKRLKVSAAECDRSMSELAREAVQRYLETGEGCGG